MPGAYVLLPALNFQGYDNDIGHMYAPAWESATWRLSQVSEYSKLQQPRCGGIDGEAMFGTAHDIP